MRGCELEDLEFGEGFKVCGFYFCWGSMVHGVGFGSLCLFAFT